MARGKKRARKHSASSDERNEKSAKLDVSPRPDSERLFARICFEEFPAERVREGVPTCNFNAEEALEAQNGDTNKVTVVEFLGSACSEPQELVYEETCDSFRISSISKSSLIPDANWQLLPNEEHSLFNKNGEKIELEKLDYKKDSRANNYHKQMWFCEWCVREPRHRCKPRELCAAHDANPSVRSSPADMDQDASFRNKPWKECYGRVTGDRQFVTILTGYDTCNKNGRILHPEKDSEGVGQSPGIPGLVRVLWWDHRGCAPNWQRGPCSFGEGAGASVEDCQMILYRTKASLK